MWKVRELADKVTNVVMNYTEIEAKVREATNDEAWGPTGQIMQELAHSTFTYEHFPEVMSMLWKRMLQDNKQHWRRSYKALLVLNYLIKNGSERVVTSAREHIYDLRSLENYTYIDDIGKDQGVNIRHKVKELIDFIQDDDRLREERKKAKKNKDKYIGMSSDMVGMRFGSGRDTWDDRSYNKDNGGDWDESNSVNRYRDRSFEDDYELDKEDSDTESKQSNIGNVKKYRDTDQPNSPTHIEKRVNINLNPSLSNSPKKTNKPLKKVDLGAAANFGRDTSQSPLPHSSNDLLNDDFDPRGNEIQDDIKSATEFGDFETAFGDFGSAFSQNPSQNFPPPNLLGSTPNTLPNVIPPRNMMSPNVPNIGMGGINMMGESNLLGNQLVGNGPPANSAQPQSILGVSVSPNNHSNASKLPVLQHQQISNNDLLGDLTDFNNLSLQNKPATSFTPSNNNLGILNSSNSDFLDGLTPDTNKDVASVGLNLLSDYVREVKRRDLPRRKKTKLDKELEYITCSCFQNLKSLNKLTSQDDIEHVLAQIDNVIKCLPGPLTVQKLMAVDVKSYEYYVENCYNPFIEKLIQLFDHSFPFKEGRLYEQVKILFSIEDPYFFKSNLNMLMKYLRENNEGISYIIVTLLQILLNSEGLLAFNFSYVFSDLENTFTKEDRMASWYNFLKVVVSLPSRLANILSGKQPDFFIQKHFAGFLIFNVIKIIDFISCILKVEPDKENYVNYQCIAQLLDKILIHFNENLSSEILKIFTEIVALLTNTRTDKYKIYQRIFQRIFCRLERPSVEILAKLFLLNIDPKQYLLKETWGKELLSTQNWKFVLCTKIPLLSYFEMGYSNLIFNLVIYLSSVSHTDLITLFINLLNVWADRSSISHTSVEQHIFISKLIILIVNSFENIGLNDSELSIIKTTVFSGMSVHLESTSEIIRSSGMKTGEIIINFLSKDIDNEEPMELKFEYDNLKK
ncbi:hypothetical protein NQ317_013802 [Molorchus minor]|uniref:ENTH domain-containing protein n=1 Tax=Molorchus minor TaxID=1323400 RepID=A0ABQ9J4G9_9CUCU|nr:hypothetical protein NQ317_013802 [Molorchus minor]